MYWLNGMYETSLAPPISPVNKENGIDQPSNLGAVPLLRQTQVGEFLEGANIYIYTHIIYIYIYLSYIYIYHIYI